MVPPPHMPRAGSPEILAPLLNRRPSSVRSDGRLALALMDALAMLIAVQSLDPNSTPGAYFSCFLVAWKSPLAVRFSIILV